MEEGAWNEINQLDKILNYKKYYLGNWLPSQISRQIL